MKLPAMLLLLLPACVSTDYLGREYPPTNRVLVYYDLEDLTRPNRVIGHLQAEAMTGTDYSRIETELVEQAMAKGADALVVEGADMVDAGARTPGERYPPVLYHLDDDGELRHEPAPGRPTPRFTRGIGDVIVNALLVKF